MSERCKARVVKQFDKAKGRLFVSKQYIMGTHRMADKAQMGEREADDSVRFLLGT